MQDSISAGSFPKRSAAAGQPVPPLTETQVRAAIRDLADAGVVALEEHRHAWQVFMTAALGGLPVNGPEPREGGWSVRLLRQSGLEVTR